MNGRQRRLIAEKEELDRRVAKLDTFIDNERPRSIRPQFSAHFDMLVQQSYVMHQYSDILQARIDDLEDRV